MNRKINKDNLISNISLTDIIIIGICVCYFLNNYINDSENLTKNTVYESYFEDIPLVALSNDTLLSGSSSGLLFVQSGTYNEKMYYQLMIKNETDGKMKYIQLNANDTYIYEYEPSANQTPHIKIDWQVKKVYGEIVQPETISERLSVNTDFMGFSDILAPINSISIYVPEGTVDRNMSINFN